MARSLCVCIVRRALQSLVVPLVCGLCFGAVFQLSRVHEVSAMQLQCEFRGRRGAAETPAVYSALGAACSLSMWGSILESLA